MSIGSDRQVFVIMKDGTGIRTGRPAWIEGQIMGRHSKEAKLIESTRRRIE